MAIAPDGVGHDPCQIQEGCIRYSFLLMIQCGLRQVTRKTRLGFRGRAGHSMHSGRCSGLALVVASLIVIGWCAPDATAEDRYGPVQRADLGNIYAVNNGPKNPTHLKFDKAVLLTKIQTYHWNNARGQKPGTISLVEADGRIHGPWKARGLPGQGGVRNAYWVAEPRLRLAPGTYTVKTSSNRTWATNAGTNWRGFVTVEWRDVLPEDRPSTPDNMADTGGDQPGNAIPWVTELLRLHQPGP